MPNPGTCISHCEKENDDEETVEVRLYCVELLARGGRRTRARAREREREREREASSPIGLGRAREESEGEEAPRVPAFPRRRGSAREFFSLTALLSRVWSMGCFLHASYFCQLKPMMKGYVRPQP